MRSEDLQAQRGAGVRSGQGFLCFQKHFLIRPAELRRKILELLRLNRSPREIALGIAIGVFIAITPLYGFHTVMVICAAFLVKRANKIAIFLGTNISTTLTFPLITWAGYTIGTAVLPGRYPPLVWDTFRHFDYRMLLSLYYPLFIGSLILGSVLAVVFYFLTLLLMALWSKRRGAALILFCLAAPFLSVSPAGAGETIVYSISPLGSSVYHDSGIVTLGGVPMRLVTFKTRTVGFSDEERIYSDPATHLPLRVERRLAISIKHERLIEEYDQETHRLLITKYAGDRKVKTYEYEADGPFHNAVTLPFYLRTMGKIEPGLRFTVRLPDTFTVVFSGIEDISVPAGKFKAYRFDSEPKRFQIWISADEDRIPLKIRGLGRALVMRSRE